MIYGKKRKGDIMRGKVIHYDWSASTGMISGDDGKRYYFSKDEWKSGNEPVNGLMVDFVVQGVDQATEVIAITHFANDDAGDWLVTLLLCIFLGYFGVHRFYTKQIGIGILQLITGGGCGIWWLIDIIMIVTDSYRDGNGKPLVRRY